MDESSSVSVPASDAELLNTIRSGDHGAYGMLRVRHATAARRLASQLVTGPTAADDVVASAFTTVLDAIGRGGGPTDAFRPYLLTAVRQAASGSEERADPGRRADPGEGQVPGDGQQVSGPGRPFELAAAGPQDSSLVAAFLSLPERWRAVLWHTEIERAAPSEVAPLLGLDAAGVTELAGNARDGLRQAYLHLAPADPGGEETDLADVGAALRGTVAPLILGGAAAAYLAGSHGPAGLADSPGSPGSPAFPAAGKTARTGTTAGAAASWLPGKLRGFSPRQHALAAGTMLAVAGIAAFALTLGPGTGPTTADGHRVAAGALGPPPSLGPPAPSAPRASSAPSWSVPSSSAPSSSAPPAAPASQPVEPPAAATGIAQHASGRTPLQAHCLRPPGRRQSPAPALAAPTNPALAARWSGAGAGGRTCIAASGPACVQVPIAAANRTDGFRATAVTRREACRRPVRIPVAGVTSAASIRSARAVRCGRGQRASPQHASSDGTGASRVGSDASGWPETSWQQTTRPGAGRETCPDGTEQPGMEQPGRGRPGRAPRGPSPHGLASPRLGAAGQGTAENKPSPASRPGLASAARSAGHAGRCVQPRAGAVRSFDLPHGHVTGTTVVARQMSSRSGLAHVP